MSEPKTTVIHHSADFDGLFCREIARKFLPADTEFIGWDFKDPKVPMPGEGAVYILDLSPDCVEIPDQMVNALERIIWIDHHKTAIDKWPAQIPGYRIDGVAACRLAWFYFKAEQRYKSQTTTADFTWFQGHYPWATKEDFVNRKLEEPLAVRLAGEYDIWDKRDTRAEVFQFGLRSRELTEFDWEEMFSTKKVTIAGLEQSIAAGFSNLLPDGTAVPMVVASLLKDGELLQRYQQKNDASIMNGRSFVREWEGLKFLCLNTALCNSLTFASRDTPETGHDALMGFYFDGKAWTISLYHAKHRMDLDLSLIAVKHGGGGHKGGCGFRSENWPFEL